MKPNEDQLPDLLRELKSKGDGFKRPGADYFTQMTQRAMIEAQQPKTLRLTTSNVKYRRWLAYAASVAIILSMAWAFLPNASEVGPATASVEASTVTLDDLDDDEIMEYINDNLQDFEIEQFADEVELY